MIKALSWRTLAIKDHKRLTLTLPQFAKKWKLSKDNCEVQKIPIQEKSSGQPTRICDTYKGSMLQTKQ
jgi:hypothetical protein